MRIKPVNSHVRKASFEKRRRKNKMETRTENSETYISQQGYLHIADYKTLRDELEVLNDDPVDPAGNSFWNEFINWKIKHVLM